MSSPVSTVYPVCGQRKTSGLASLMRSRSSITRWYGCEFLRLAPEWLAPPEAEGQTCRQMRASRPRAPGRDAMDVRDAVASRFSCRAFLPTPVPLAVVREILDRAARAPSGGNLQPWRVDALAGHPLATLKAMMRAREAELPRGEGAEYQIYPDPLKEPYYARRRDVGALLYAA